MRIRLIGLLISARFPYHLQLRRLEVSRWEVSTRAGKRLGRGVGSGRGDEHEWDQSLGRRSREGPEYLFELRVSRAFFADPINFFSPSVLCYPLLLLFTAPCLFVACRQREFSGVWGAARIFRLPLGPNAAYFF